MKKTYWKLVKTAGLILVSDQAAKALVLHYMPLYHSVSLIPGCLNLVHVQNKGVAFGMFGDYHSGLVRLLFILLSLTALVLLFYFYKNTPKGYGLLEQAFLLIFGGALGNLVDRIRLGRVVDFIDFHIGNLHWPAFNIADSCITVGMIILFYHLIFKKLPEETKR